MITRQLIAALVGVSLAAGTLGTASAQTNQAPVVQQTAPAKAASVASKPAKPVVAQSAKAKSKTHVARSTPRKHLAHRLHKGTKVAQHGKRIRISHAGKRSTKHV